MVADVHKKPLFHKLAPKHLASGLQLSRTVQRFAEDIGLVYFGAVDPTEDDYRLVRGITSSITYRDRHFAIGTFQGYDVAFVIRSDTITYVDRRTTSHRWAIMTFDLHTSYHLPHIFIGHRRVRELLLAKYSHLTPLIVSTQAAHDPGFINQYMVSSDIAHATEVEFFINPELTLAIKTYFKDYAIEILDNTVYLLSTEAQPSRADLERMLKNGIWLTEKLDALAHRVKTAGF